MTDEHPTTDDEHLTNDLVKKTSAPKLGSKECTLCGKDRDVLVRCQVDETNKWHFVCPGKCWTSVSGGEVDAKGHKNDFPFYRYGGMWKNRHADGPLNAKKPKKKASKRTSKHEHASKESSPPLTDEDAHTADAATQA